VRVRGNRGMYALADFVAVCNMLSELVDCCGSLWSNIRGCMSVNVVVGCLMWFQVVSTI